MIQYVRIETTADDPIALWNQIMRIPGIIGAKLLVTDLATELNCSETTPWFYEHPNFGWQRVPSCEAASAMISMSWRVRLGELESEKGNESTLSETDTERGVQEEESLQPSVATNPDSAKTDGSVT